MDEKTLHKISGFVSPANHFLRMISAVTWIVMNLMRFVAISIMKPRNMHRLSHVPTFRDASVDGSNEGGFDYII